MCYGYGTTREILVVFDNSGSMGLYPPVGPIEVVVQGTDITKVIEDPFIGITNVGRLCADAFRGLVERVECRCPRWGAAGYSAFGPQITVAWTFRRGISQAQAGLDGLTFTQPSGELPVDALLDLARAWSERVGEIGLVTQPQQRRPKIDPETGEPILDEDGDPVYEAEPRVTLGGKPLGEHPRPPRRLLLWVADEPQYTITGEGPEDFELTDTGPLIDALREAQITVIGWDVHRSGVQNDLSEQMAEIAEATGGVAFDDLANRLGHIEEIPPPPLSPNDPPAYAWAGETQKMRDWIDETVELLHTYKWKKVGYPYV